MSNTIETSIKPEKLELLRQHLAAGRAVDYAEVLAVHWPGQTRYYAQTAWHLAPNFKQIPWEADVALWAGPGVREMSKPVFVELLSTYATSDDSISFTISDPDGDFWALHDAHGDGAKVEVLGYLGGEIDCVLPPLWWGLLQTPEDTDDPDLLSVTATNGYRNASTLTPRRLMSTVTCQRVWAGQLDTQEKIDKNGCPNNRHLPGGTVGLIDPVTNLPFAACPKTRPACLARIGGDPDELPILEFKSILGDQLVPQSKGPGVLATTKGNESALNQPLPVVYGHRILRELPVLTMQIQPNPAKPEDGTFSGIFPVSEGPILSISNAKINNSTPKPGHHRQALGTERQHALNLTDTKIAANYSSTAHFRDLLFGAFSGRTAADFKGECEVYGRSTVRSPNGSGGFNEEYTTNRAKCLYDLLTNNRYGNGESDALLQPSDWQHTFDDDTTGGVIVDCDQTVAVQDAEGGTITGSRSTFNAQVEGTATEELVKDICLWGNMAMFQFEGKRRIKMLGLEAINANVPTFTDAEGGNIWVGQGTGSSLRILRHKATDLPDQLQVFFEDEAHNNIRRPLLFDYEDVRAKRGKALGDTTPAPRSKQLNAYGINNLGEAVRMANIIGDVGEFSSGGRKNNLGVRFLTEYLTPEGLQLYPYRLIKVVNERVNRHRESTGEAAEYFIVQSLRRFGDMRGENGLMLEVTAWWYPRGYWATLEAESLPETLMVGAGGEALLEEEEITD